MSVRNSEILEQILALPPSDRAELADSILASLEPSDPDLLKLWGAEAEDRVAAFKRGEIEAIPAEVVFGEIDSDSSHQLRLQSTIDYPCGIQSNIGVSSNSGRNAFSTPLSIDYRASGKGSL